MGDFITRNLKKKVTRANEKLLQNLGKADKTKDDEFEEHCFNFHKQQKSADRLQKEIKAYVTSIKAMATASRGFYEALREIYEADWPAVEHVKALSESVELVWEDYHDKLADQALNPINSYAQQFGDLDKKINKRGRKMVDYDGARHTYDQMAHSKKQDDPKLINAQKDLQDKKRLYDDLNIQLTDELPALYDSRITFYVNHFQTIFNLEHHFHTDTASMTRDLCNKMDDLGHALGRLRVPRKQSHRDVTSDPEPSLKPSPQRPPQPSVTPPQETKPQTDSNNHSNAVYPRLDESAMASNGKRVKSDSEERNPFADEEEDEEKHTEDKPEDKDVKPDINPNAQTKPPPSPTITQTPLKAAEKPVEDLPAEPKSTVNETNSTDAVQKVRATHRYTAEDADELSFEAGEVMRVIQFEDPEDQDDGWLMGIRETDGAKGVFPANFTKPI